jgi:hypothetical protein
MKKICITLANAIFLLICFNGLQAQTAQSKLNQVELMKQFIGSWECSIGKDTTALWDFKTYGTGLECYVRYVTRGKTFREVKSLYGYDKRVDKFIAASMVKGMDLEIFAVWFLSNRNYEIIYYSDISNPEKASVKNEGKIDSPDKLIVTKIVNNKPVSNLAYTRVK